MSKGIRGFVEIRFGKLLPRLQVMGGAGFRRKVLDETVEKFGISMASASTAYNYVIQKMRKEQPESVAGLGRTEHGTNMLGSSGNLALNSAAAPRGKRIGLTDTVTLVQAKDGIVVGSITRAVANDLVKVRRVGKPKLIIQEDMEVS